MYQEKENRSNLLSFNLFEATFLVEGFQSGMDTSDLLALQIGQLHKHDSDIERASEVLTIARVNSKEQFNRRYAHRLQKPDYPQGSLVLVRNNRLEDTLNKFKLDPRYLGPYEVVQRTVKGNYILKELDGAVHQQPYAGFRLISYISREDPILLEEYSNEEEIISPAVSLDLSAKQDIQGLEDNFNSESETDSTVELDCLAIIADPQTYRTSKTRAEEESFQTQMHQEDVILGICPEFMNLIVKRKKTHDFRSYHLQKETVRIWFYIHDIIETIQYMAITQAPRKPGERIELPGIGNIEFNQGMKGQKLGYPILELYELVPAIRINNVPEFDQWEAQGPLYPSASMIKEWSWIDLRQIF